MIIGMTVTALNDDVDAVLDIALYGYVSAEVVELLLQHSRQHNMGSQDCVQDERSDGRTLLPKIDSKTESTEH